MIIGLQAVVVVGVPSCRGGGAAALDIQAAHKLMGLGSALKPAQIRVKQRK